MLKPGATDYHQPHAVEQNCRLQAEISDSGTKDSFLPDLRVEFPEDNLAVVGRAYVVQVLQVRVKGILDSIVLLFRRGARQIRLILWNFTLMRTLASLSTG